jgi:hypothetical protein
MKILIIIAHSGLTRHIERVLELAAEAGHEMEILVTREKAGLVSQSLQQVCVHPNVRKMKFVNSDYFWRPVLTLIRVLLDLGPYLHPDHPSPDLINRYDKHVPLAIVGQLKKPPLRYLLVHSSVRALLRQIEMMIPPPPAITAMLAKKRPDAVFTTPYIFPNSEDIDYLKAAIRLGIPSFSAIPSWDNLTTKGTGHVPVDRLFMWNEALQEEAKVLHDLNPVFVTVTGAPTFDHLFRWTPSVPREEFCARAGIASDRPLLLYLCSSGSISKNEAKVVLQFAGALASQTKTRDCLLLVRPHPLNYKIWKTRVDLPPNVRLYPNHADLPDNSESIENYCHSIHYAKAMVGLNTSAFLEASILGRICIALPSMQGCYDKARFGHFRHLANGNFIHTPSTLENAASQLGTMLESGQDEREAARRAFVQHFLRPRGLEREASSHILETIEEVVRSPALANARTDFFMRKSKQHTVVFVLIGLSHFPYQESVISALSRSSCKVYLAILTVKTIRTLLEENTEDSPAGELVESFRAFLRAHPNVELVLDISKAEMKAPLRATRLRSLRSCTSYIRRLPPDNFYRQRWFSYTRGHLGTVMDQRWVHWLLALPGAEQLLGWLDQRLSPRKEVLKRLKRLRPDMVFVSPGNMRYSQEVEWLKAARRLGIRTGIVTLSWDNLSTKGLIHIRPDYLFVWNDSHAREARTIHHIPETSTFVVGAPFFDKWSDSGHLLENREHFLPALGLDPGRRYIIYFGSSANVADNEAWLARELHEALAQAPDAALRDLQILLRPHPGNRKVCADLVDLPIVLSKDKDMGIPFSDARKRLFYNLLYHAELAVSLNTSAILDAIALGKPCISIRTDRYQDTHIGAIHFRQLLDAGAVVLAEGVADCVRLVGEHLAGSDPSREQRQDFFRRFMQGSIPGMNAGESVARITNQLLDGGTALTIKQDIAADPLSFDRSSGL